MKSARPRVILILHREMVDELEFKADGERLLSDPEVKVISYPSGLGDSLVEELKKKNLFHPDSLLVQSPFGGFYALADEANEVFAYEKHFSFTQLCGYLGAKEVKIEEVALQKEDRTSAFSARLGAEGEFKLAPVNAKAEIDKEQAERFARKFLLHTFFEGASPNFTEVERLLTEKCLAGEQHIESLVGFRKAENLVKELEVSLNLSKESKRNFRFAASLIAGVPTLLQVKAIADHQSSIQTVIEYSLTYKVIF
jgi:hypothetical protein